MIEVTRLLRWLDTTLRGDATLTTLVGGRIYFGVAPQGATYPLVRVLYDAADDLDGLGAARIWGDGEITLVAIGPTASPLALEAIADRIDTLLHGASATLDPVEIYSIVRVRPICRTAPAQSTGVIYTQLGGTYSVQVGAL